MNKIQVLNTSKTIDSREVAEMLGKEHRLILRDIEGSNDRKGIIQVLNENQLGLVDYFIESNYKDGKGETRKCYLVTKMGCELLGNKQQGEKGILFTAKYVKRFNEMEQQIQEPQFKLLTTYKEALIELVATIEEKEKIEAEKNKLIHDKKVYTASEIAKELGFKSAQELNKDLKEKKIQYKVNNTWVLCARYSENDYTTTRQIELETGKIIYDTRWTGKGRDWLVNNIYK